MSKQDRQGARTPAALERKYPFGQISKNKRHADNQNVMLIQLQQSFAKYQNSVNENINGLRTLISNMQEEIKKSDANIQTWFFSGIPTLENQPAIEWADEETKEKHVGDIYYNEDDCQIYLFKCTDGIYEWVSCTLSKETENLDYTVTFLVDGAVYEIISVKSGNSVHEPTTIPTSETGVFVSWQLNGENVVFPYTPTANTEIIALFQIMEEGGESNADYP